MKRLLLLAIILAACSETPTTEDPARHEITVWSVVKEITLSDGTLCAVAVMSSDYIAIDCNWRTG